MEITIKLERKSDELVKIELPCYMKNSDLFYYKIISESNCIVVTDASSPSIDSRPFIPDHALFNGAKKSSKEEFEGRFFKIVNTLTEELKK